MDNSNYALQMQDITVEFPGVLANNHVSIDCKKGEVLGLLGENGAGKTTLMNVLYGLYEPTTGKVFLDGKEVHITSPLEAIKNGIGMVHQHFKLVDTLSVIENVILGIKDDKQRLDLESAKKRLLELCEEYELYVDPDEVVWRLPVGKQQWVEILKALYRDCKLLILDEPTAVLTEKEAAALLESIRGMASRGIAVIFITHRLQEVLNVCDKVVIMRDGKVVKDTPASETSVDEITKCMVGRSVDLSAVREIRDCSDARTIMSIRKLWVDMPGEIVRNVNLDVKEGEILGIGGLAGQGKLGIPNGVMGLYEAGGTVEFDGKPIPLNNPRKCLDAQLAFVSEDRRGVGLLLDETLEWNVAFPAMQIQNKFLKKYGPITWRDTKAIHDVTQKYIDELKIKCTSSKQKARELSGGNQQKVCLAKAFALQPRFLFVSEPTRGIDVGAKALVLDALKKFNRENGVTVVMISSELEELRTTCDRIAIVSGGRIVGILPATESSETFGALMVSQVK